MNTKLFSKQNIMCAVAMIIIVASYAAQRILELVITPGKNVALLISIIYIILLAVVFYLIVFAAVIIVGLPRMNAVPLDKLKTGK